MKAKKITFLILESISQNKIVKEKRIEEIEKKNMVLCPESIEDIKDLKKNIDDLENVKDAILDAIDSGTDIGEILAFM